MVLTVPRKRAAVTLGMGPSGRSTPLGKWRRLRIVLRELPWRRCPVRLKDDRHSAAHVAARCTQALHEPRVWEIARVLWRRIARERCDRGRRIQWNRCVVVGGTKLGPSANQVGRRRHGQRQAVVHRRRRVHDTEIKFSCGLRCDETITRDRWIQPREGQRSTLSGIRVFRIVVRHQLRHTWRRGCDFEGMSKRKRKRGRHCRKVPSGRKWQDP
ncbi:hypothetical protein BKA62DRAFT_723223 [Auriculariales sp. MPI-PUGE-AT-0066]|nr:hypothetical protein BKA62DRAFT_723223 [Auriculariales sp. MPI-PUGE-AT-0066]